MHKKVIVFAPHQDDEILACSGTIHLLKKSGADIYIVFATNGDFYGKESAAVRLKESMDAAKLLQIDEEKIIILGFADTGMDYKDSFLWKLYHALPNEIVSSPVSSVTYHPQNLEEYSMQKLGTHLPYTKNAFVQIINYLINDIRPDIIFVSSILDAHGDHAALCKFVTDAVYKSSKDTLIYQYIIHSGDDKNWPRRGSLYYSRPQNVTEELWQNRITVTIGHSFEKQKLIQLFESQLSPSGYLLSFAKQEEIFFDTKEVDGS